MTTDIRKIKVVTSTFLAAAIVAIFVAVVTIFGELHAPLKDWLKTTFSHHWIGKGVLSAALFIVLFLAFLLKNPTDEHLNRSMKTAFWLSIVSSLAILIFYCYKVILAH